MTLGVEQLEFNPRIRILPWKPNWRGRAVTYRQGAWSDLIPLVPKFELQDFTISQDLPGNPYIKAVVRQPLGSLDDPVPVGAVSNSYSLVQHAEIVGRCFEALETRGVDCSQLRCEVGLTSLGEWMNFRAYFPQEYNFRARDNDELALRLECFNSVDGSSKLVLLLGWLRFVCSNGMVIGETKAELRDVHDEHLDLNCIPKMIGAGLRKVKMDIKRLTRWESTTFSQDRLKDWTNTAVSDAWGKRAACRVYHVCCRGTDVEIADPFAPGEATDKPVKYVAEVPGSPSPACTLYDVSQALSWIATHRNNAEERVLWQAGIRTLVDKLSKI